MRYLCGEGRVGKWTGADNACGTEDDEGRDSVGVPVRVESGVIGAAECDGSKAGGWGRGLVLVGAGEM